MQTPCVQECTLNMDDICVGCGRTLNEVMQWTVYSDQQRDEVSMVSQGRLMSMAFKKPKKQ